MSIVRRFTLSLVVAVAALGWLGAATTAAVAAPGDHQISTADGVPPEDTHW
ncbi:hypothetical protein [Actinophytocola sp. NPDC049390]|uniref:hypothetical protein n=1 Tax=Actinophytocola sp. NPDC049390 TaxID=3363894 RepID=UPI0037911B7B